MAKLEEVEAAMRDQTMMLPNKLHLSGGADKQKNDGIAGGGAPPDFPKPIPEKA